MQITSAAEKVIFTQQHNLQETFPGMNKVVQKAFKLHPNERVTIGLAKKQNLYPEAEHGDKFSPMYEETCELTLSDSKGNPLGTAMDAAGNFTKNPVESLKRMIAKATGTLEDPPTHHHKIGQTHPPAGDGAKAAGEDRPFEFTQKGLGLKDAAKGYNDELAEKFAGMDAKSNPFIMGPPDYYATRFKPEEQENPFLALQQLNDLLAKQKK